LRGHAGCGEGRCRTGCPVLCRPPRLAVNGPCRAGGRLSAASPFCAGYLYPAVSDTGAGNDEQYFKSHCAGDPQDAGRADTGHAAVQGAERSAGEGGHDAQSETAYLVSDEEFDRQLDELGWSPGDAATRLGMYMEVGMYNLEKSIRDAFRSLLELLFAAASLLIDTVRTFFLVVLSILGPIAFAFSVWDGFQSTLSQWFTRYISVYLWLPVSDLFSCMLAKIQVLMLQNDILELQNNPNYSLDNSNSVYVIFMLIGIIGYFTVPTVAGWIVQAGGAGNYNRNINRTATKAGGFAAGAAGSGLGNIGGRLRGK